MKTYLVGGSVRDKLLGITPNDTDYLVTDSSEEELLDRGLVKVGLSFPIFLDRTTGEEFTLASSVEEDLRRRDLTVNAIAMDDSGHLIDPFSGLEDLRKKVLRHVRSENFFTDPLRVLRTVRFLLQLPGFKIDPETKELIKKVAETQEYAQLSGERIIKELKRVLSFDRPSRFFLMLLELEALAPHFREFVEVPESFPEVHESSVRFAWLCSKLSLNQLGEVASRLGIQNEWRETASAWISFQGLKPGPASLLDFFYALDAFRRPEILEKLTLLAPEKMKNVNEAFRLTSGIGLTSLGKTLAGKEISLGIREERLRRLEASNKFR